MTASKTIPYNFVVGCLVVLLVFGFILHFHITDNPRTGWSCHPSSNLVGYLYQSHPKATMVTTADPLVWGPTIWPSLHIIAENYPKRASPTHQRACHNFLNGLPWMLPCGECGYHFRTYEAESKSNNFKKPCLGRQNLRRYFVDAHNQVNLKQRHTKPQWTTQEASQHYAKMPIVINNPDKWASSRVL